MPRHVPGRVVCSVEWCTGLAHGDGLCSTHYRQIRAAGALAPWREIEGKRIRPCEDCGVDVESKYGRGRYCLACKRRKAAAKAAAQFAANPERVRQRGRESSARMRADPERRARKQQVARTRRLQRDYGLTEQQYDALVEEQLGFCAICHQLPGVRGFVVDHNHETGEVRGLLCDRCNTGLGLFRDLPDNLRRATAYLEERGGREIRYLTMTVVEAS
jgi:hypothetical protein